MKNRRVTDERQRNFLAVSYSSGPVLDSIVVVDCVAESIEGILPGLYGIKHLSDSPLSTGEEASMAFWLMNCSKTASP